MEFGFIGFRIVGRAHMELDYRHPLIGAFPGQGRPAFQTEATLDARRRLVNISISLDEADIVALKGNKSDERRPGMAATAVAVAVTDADGWAIRLVAN
jgi:hypothetical protein